MGTTTFTKKATAIDLLSTRTCRRWLFLISLCIITLTFASTAFAQNPTPNPITTARVMTDTSDYAPGSTAKIFGSGFQPGETVTLQVLHADGTPATGADHDPWTVTADILGGVNTTWHVCEDDCLGSLLKLTAVGQSSALWAATWFTDAEAPPNLSACGTTLMNRTTNDGSFESNAVNNVNFSPTSLPPVWTITSTGPGIGGLLSNPPHSTVLAGADGSDGLFADGYNPNTTTATSYNLLGGSYTTVSAGDIFSWSFMVNAYGPNGSATLKLNFGAGDITVGTGTSGDGNILAFRTYSGTYTATAADAAGGQLRVKFSITNATGDNVYGDNIILKVLPVGLPDGDGDGVPDNCDNCPTIANPAQDNKAACIAVEAASATCLESQIHLNNPNQSGNVTVSAKSPSPSSITFEILATCGADQLSFYLNGILLGSTTANPSNQCRCGPPLQTFTVSDAGLIASAWQAASDNTWRVVKSGTGTALAWVHAIYQTGATSQTLCIYNLNGGNCNETNLCSAQYTFSTVDESQLFVSSLPLIVTPYTNGQLPQEINISSLTNGQYLLCVSGPDKPESIRFEILNTNCGGVGVYQFFLNNIPIGSANLDPTGSCDCGPALQTFLVTNPTLLANWNSGGNNTLSFNLNGGGNFTGFLSWVRAIVTKGTESARAVLYDYNGGNADVLNLCDANYTNGTITGSASVNLATLSENCVPFTKAGEEKIMINGLCNQAPVAVCKNIQVSANANCQGVAVAADFNNGSSDPDGDEITFSVSPAGPYALGVTNVTLTATDPSGAFSTCTATVTVVDDTAPTISSCPENKSASPNNALCTYKQVGTGWNATANDNCSTTTTIKYTLSGATISAVDAYTTLNNVVFNLGVTTVTAIAYDASNNASTSCSFTVTVASTLVATCSNTNPSMYYGYTGDQSATIKAKATGGVGPYTISITMNRPLNCNVITSSGDELWTAASGTSVNNVCPTSGPGLIPVSTGTGIASGVDYSVNVTLMQDATFTATITDANGCVTTCTTSVHAEDARCFAGNSGNAKITICHQTGSTNKPCVKICVDESAVAAHLAHGDFLGICTPTCVAPVYTTRQANVAALEVLTPIEFNVKAFPNPTENQFILVLESNSNEKINVVVYDALGRTVKKFERGNSQQPIYFGKDLKAGAYFVELRQGENRKTIKLIKQ